MCTRRPIGWGGTLTTAVIIGVVGGSVRLFHTMSICIAGIVVNCVWIYLLVFYKKLNVAKFKVIQEMEKEISYRCFSNEEDFYKADNRKDFATIERWIPVIWERCFM